MAEYKFYYDETEHSRSLNHKTIIANEFYDGFVTAIVGWAACDEAALERKYAAFELKHRSPGAFELKSTSLNKRQFRYGLRFLSKANVRMIGDYLDLFDENTLVYYSFSSKVERLIYRLFPQRCMPGINMDLLMYSLAKLVVQYRPEKVVEAFYGDSGQLIEAVRAFLFDRIERNTANFELKRLEIEQCELILAIMDTATPLDNTEWEYCSSFEGFALYLSEHPNIDNYELVIDQEEKTAEAAKELGFPFVRQADSANCFGVRMADMLAGILGKLLKSIRAELMYCSVEDGLEKKLLDKRWFDIDDARLGLYKQLRRVLVQSDKCWYKAYGSGYSDDLVVLIALLNYFSNFESSEELKKDLDKHPEAFNVCCCRDLQQHFEIVKFPAPWRAGVYNIRLHLRPRLKVSDTPTVYNVVKVMLAEDGAPMIVVRESDDMAFILPDELVGWVELLLDMGAVHQLFPCDVRFQIVNGVCRADIL